MRFDTFYTANIFQNESYSLSLQHSIISLSSQFTFYQYESSHLKPLFAILDLEILKIKCFKSRLHLKDCMHDTNLKRLKKEGMLL